MKTKKHDLDPIDLRILDILQADARIQNNKLADRVNLSPSACLNRVKLLHDHGFVKASRAQLDLGKVCSHVHVFCTVTLSDYSAKNIENFEKRVKEMPELVECFKVSGHFDYLLRFVCVDMAGYHRISERTLNADIGVTGLCSHVVLDVTKTFSGYPLHDLLK